MSLFCSIWASGRQVVAILAGRESTAVCQQMALPMSLLIFFACLGQAFVGRTWRFIGVVIGRFVLDIVAIDILPVIPSRPPGKLPYSMTL